jgi:hypothetical protein
MCLSGLADAGGPALLKSLCSGGIRSTYALGALIPLDWGSMLGPWPLTQLGSDTGWGVHWTRPSIERHPRVGHGFKPYRAWLSYYFSGNSPRQLV